MTFSRNSSTINKLGKGGKLINVQKFYSLNIHFSVIFNIVLFSIPSVAFSKDRDLFQSFEQISNNEINLAKVINKKLKIRLKNRKKKVGQKLPPCPIDMVLVASRKKRIRVCVDKYEVSRRTRKLHITKRYPLGYQSRDSCMKICRKRKRRLLNHREWVVACEATKPSKCNIYKRHPILRKVRSKKKWVVKGVNCKTKRKRWSKTCMNDPSLNKLSKGLAKNKGFSKCKSIYGAYNMVGNLGEWVAGTWVNKSGGKVGRFNGGLYPQNNSSCKYTTIAHGPDYKDYSIGCRCGMDPKY